MRGITSEENLAADVEGDIEDVDGVLRITSIRLHYRLATSGENREKVDRALEAHAEKCPAYQSVKGCIDCTWDMELVES